MEELREKLCMYIELYGFTDIRTVEVSQALDKPIVVEQRKLLSR